MPFDTEVQLMKGTDMGTILTRSFIMSPSMFLLILLLNISLCFIRREVIAFGIISIASSITCKPSSQRC